jgi:hypothetical protein
MSSSTSSLSSSRSSLSLEQTLSMGDEVVQLSETLPGVGSLCVRKDKNIRKRRSKFTHLGRSQRAKVVKTTFEGTDGCRCFGT